MPSYVVFLRSLPTAQWSEIERLGHAQDDNDAWYQARWAARHSSRGAEVLISRVGYWALLRGKFAIPSETEKGKPGYTPEECERILLVSKMGREPVRQLLKKLNGIE